MSKTRELENIAKEIASCKVCPTLCKTAINPVPGEGNPDAEIMFIGEAPGAEEDRQGRPFVGASGQFLESMLEAIGLRRSDVFITNIVKYRPPGNRDPLPEEIKACWPWLERQINTIKPKIIGLLGRYAMNIFLPGLQISKCHGQPKRKGELIFLPLYHPAVALYNANMRTVLQEDFARIPVILKQTKSKFKQSKLLI